MANLRCGRKRTVVAVVVVHIAVDAPGPGAAGTHAKAASGLVRDELAHAVGAGAEGEVPVAQLLLVADVGGRQGPVARVEVSDGLFLLQLLLLLPLLLLLLPAVRLFRVGLAPGEGELGCLFCGLAAERRLLRAGLARCGSGYDGRRGGGSGQGVIAF